MKRYKLKKDTPTLKAGTIFVEEGDNFNDYKELVQVVPYGCPNRPFFAVSEINNFDDWFEEITKKYERWRAEEGDEYYAINWSGFVHCFRDTRQPEDDYRYKTGNYGRTVEELEAKREYDIARQVLLDDAKGGKFMRGKIVYFANYDCSTTANKWDFSSTVNIYIAQAESTLKT